MRSSTEVARRLTVQTEKKLNDGDNPRRFGGADLQGLVATGRWRDPLSAARYAHVVSHEEWDRVDMLPTMGKSVELPLPKPKAKANQ
jgi:hypothetical protein